MFVSIQNVGDIAAFQIPRFGMTLEISPLSGDGYKAIVKNEDGEIISDRPIYGGSVKAILDYADRLLNI